MLAEVISPTPDHPLIVRVWREPLSAGDEIGGEFDDEVRRSETAEWFFWIDDAPGAFFSHPVRYAFVGGAADAVSVVDAGDVPLLNGEPMWETPEDTSTTATTGYSTTSRTSRPCSTDRPAVRHGRASPRTA